MDTTEIAANLERVRERIEQTLAKCGRPGGSVLLVAVSKTFPAEAIAAAAHVGQADFGENRVQEAEVKIPRLRDTPSLRWHLVGHLQSNKARRAAELFDVIHSLDSLKLARRLDQACAELGRTLSVLLQVDLGEEETKFGADRNEVGELVGSIATLEHLRLDGLMTIPPFLEDPEEVRPYFAQLRVLRDSLEESRPGCLGLRHLSMGMSHDLEAAIVEGATIVRVGTAIFGERAYG